MGVNVKGHGMASLRRCYGREHVWKDLLRRSHGAPRQIGMASTFARQSVYNLVYGYYFGAHNGRVLKLPDSKQRIIRSVLEKVAMNIQFLEGNKMKMLKWMKAYRGSRGDAAAMEMEEDAMAMEMEAEMTAMGGGGGRRAKRRHKEQINGVTK